MTSYKNAAFNFIKKVIFSFTKKKALKIDVVNGYNIWSSIYDTEIESGNVTVFYNDILIESLLNSVKPPYEYICDFGAGTGRHYNRLIKLKPKQWVGCDVSPGMLERLKLNFPEAQSHILTNHKLHFSKDSKIDFMFSSLTIGHIKNINKVFEEWDRVLKKNGTILLTLFHPNLAHLKTARSFKSLRGDLYAIEHYTHSLQELHRFFKKYEWKIISFQEMVVDDKVKPILFKNNLSKVYPKIKDTAIVCGFVLKKE